MPIYKANQVIPVSPPIFFIFGDIGIGKTSLVNTCDDVLLCDFDRGSHRSAKRKDTLVLSSWEDVLAEEQQNSFKAYKTIGIDTAKAALDDFLMEYVCRKDYKLRTNKLQAYGAIGDAFKLFINARRNEKSAIVIIAHSKRDEETKMWLPEVTGQSYSLLLRIADQIGHITFNDQGQRCIKWDPSNSQVGKNTARLPVTLVPDVADPTFDGFMGRIVTDVFNHLTALTEEQQKARQLTDEYVERISAVATPDALTTILDEVNKLPPYLAIPLKNQIAAKKTEKQYKYNGTAFVPGDAPGGPATGTPADPKAAPPAQTAPPAQAAPPVEATKADPPAENKQPDAADGMVTEMSLFIALQACKDIADVSDLYHVHSEFIESHPATKAKFDNAVELLKKLDEKPATQKPAEPLTGAKRDKLFKAKLKTPADIKAIADKVESLKDVANIYYSNTEMIEADLELAGLFNALKTKYAAEA